MGSVQRMATVVVVALVAMSTVLFLYLGDENNRIETEAAEQQASAIERARTNYISLCLSCHGPAGEGYTEPGTQGTGRIGAALGGINTSLNQQGINSQGTPVPGGVAGRETIIRNTITNGLKNPDGSYRMPPFSDANGGPLNDEQINQLVLLIQHGDWNETYNAAVEASGGYPTPPPAPGAGATQTAQAEAGTAPAAPTSAPAGGDAQAAQDVTITMHDIYFDPAEVTIPANTPVTVKLPNQGAALHDFTIDALGINVQVNPGDTGEVTINAPAGEYEYYCSIPGHKAAGMVGKLIVEEGGGAAPAASSGDSAPADTGAAAAPTETPAADSGAGAASAQDVTVAMHDIYFDPAEFTIPANTPVKVTLPNQGAAPHDFSIDALGISVTVNPGETGEVTIDAPAGEYEYYCNIPGHKEAGMVGKLTVQ
ncbi:MAG: cupredoxin domain-containing protein [Thermomicrobiales bacterium]|nr:cupredoxin domain-containing protein [Thermomicrobiales bacterium]